MNKILKAILLNIWIIGLILFFAVCSVQYFSEVVQNTTNMNEICFYGILTMIILLELGKFFNMFFNNIADPIIEKNGRKKK